MPFCPKCGSEYEAGVERCADCDEVLVAHLPAEEQDTEREIISERLVQIAVFNRAVEANLCRTRLESEGIKCFVAHEHFGSMHLFPDESGAVRLQVEESDADRAVEILRQEPQETEVELEEEDTEAEDIQGLRCPRCGSSDVTSQKRSPVLTFVCLLFLGIPFLFMRKKWKCRACWHTWKAY